MAFSVVRCIPRRVAALLTTPPVSRSTRMICSRSTCSSVLSPAGFRRIWPDFGQRRAKAGPSRKDDRPFNEVFEFPHVSRPRPVHQSSHRVRRNLVDLPVHFAAYFLVKCRARIGYILRAIAQRRRRDRKDFQPVVEIASEELVPHHLSEVAVGCRHQPDVDGNRSWCRPAAQRTSPAGRGAVWAADPAGCRPPHPETGCPDGPSRSGRSFATRRR